MDYSFVFFKILRNLHQYLHSERILIYISTTENLYGKSVSLYIGYFGVFFQNQTCKQYLNVHLNESGFNSVLMPSCEWGSPRISFFLFRFG